MSTRPGYLWLGGHGDGEGPSRGHDIGSRVGSVRSVVWHLVDFFLVSKPLSDECSDNGGEIEKHTYITSKHIE